MNKNFKVISLGAASGFPFFKSATVHKALFISKIFVEAGYDVFAVNNEALFKKNMQEDIPIKGIYEGVNYQYTLKSPYKASTPIRRLIFRYIGMLNELPFLIKYKFNKGIDICIFYTNGSFLKLIYYRLLSLLLNFKFILVYHEYRSDFDLRKNNVLFNINDKLFDRYFLYFVDGVLPISEFLIAHIKSIKPNKPLLKIPPLIDFKLFVKPDIVNEPYFLYCGAAEYYDIIEFIMHSFGQLKITHNYHLYFVIGGYSNQFSKIEKLIENSPLHNKIKLLSNLSYNYLISLYINAKALLIPLRPNVRDKARAPQKLAEYVASGSPVISTNYGEVKHYFTDGKNALIADDFNIDLFAEKLEFVINNPIKAKKIGIAGKEVGKRYFDYLKYVDKVREFLNHIA